jgi:hypothetical protein
MKKIVITFGLIAGLIVAVMMVISTTLFYGSTNYECSMYVGYATMLIAFSMIFVAVKNYRDKFNSGQVSFGKAFMIGLYVTLITSTVYVIVWLVIYYRFMPDFMDKYSSFMINKVKVSGASEQEINQQVTEMARYKQMYKNPFFVILLTYAEIFPVGIMVALISALILKRKNGNNILATN